MRKKMTNIDTSYINNLTYFLNHSDEDEVDSLKFVKGFKKLFSKNKKDICWLDVGAGPGTKLVKSLQKIKGYNIKLDIIEPSKEWQDILIKNFDENDKSSFLYHKYTTTWEEFNVNKKYDLITFFHSVYGISSKSLLKIPEFLNEEGIALIVVESPNSDLNKLKKELFPYIHQTELVSSSDIIVKLLNKTKIKFYEDEEEPSQKFYVDELLDLENPNAIIPLSFILQTNPIDHHKLIAKDVQDKIIVSLKKYVKKEENGKSYINVPDKFIWIYK